jgi:DNA sulfur modification protein DndD
MAIGEFFRFIESLDYASLSKDEMRLLNVIIHNIDSIDALGAAGGKRSKFIASRVFPDFDTLSIDPPQLPNEAPSGIQQLCRLSKLKVGPFRGFAKEEEFDLNSQAILLDGPNGSGKSSFFEALEFALLGRVNDCSIKRIEVDDYLKNARQGSFQLPHLTALFEDGHQADVVPNDDIFRFCFVEKNRIDDFSRIASFTPSHQERLIASLFGIQDFNSFVDDFNESIGSYLPHASDASRELQALELSLANDKQIVGNKVNAYRRLAEEEDEIANSYQHGMGYATFVETVGSSENGLIKELTDALGKPPAAKNGAIKVGLEDTVAAVRASWISLEALREKRAARASELSFRDLYKSVLALELSNPDACPACDTPLSGNHPVAANPYLKARVGLEGLTELAEIERQIEETGRRADERARSLLVQLTNVEAHLNESEQQNEFVADLRTALTKGNTGIRSGWWLPLLGLSDEEPFESRKYLYSCVERMESQDELISQQNAEREATKKELNRLTVFREKIVERSPHRAETEHKIRQAEEALQSAEAAISLAQQKNSAEADANDVRQRIVQAYFGLMFRLKQYREALPATLLANLGQSVATLYNAFNRNDREGDLMADIRLPLKSGERITFSCKAAPNEYFDALHVLSEGHIRCLGLAILLAKNLQTNCPLLVFDDPVNAIDEDHREGIRRTLFEDPYFAERQIILTCHGEEFTKDIQNLIGVARAASECRTYTFLPHLGDNHIRREVTLTKNYIVVARAKFDRNELRDSLANARRGLEWAVNEIWKKILPSAGVRALSVQLVGPHSKPELMNLVQSLIKEMGKNTFMNLQKEQLIANLRAIDGLRQHKREWDYLNKGTHEEEDRGEFDRGIVKTVVETLERLGTAIDASKRMPPAVSEPVQTTTNESARSYAVPRDGWEGQSPAPAPESISKPN